MPETTISSTWSVSRRQILAGLALLPGAGCLGPGSTLGRSPDSAPTATHVKLKDADTIADKHEVGIDVSVVKSSVTDEHPPRIQVAITNEGSDRTVPSQDSQALREGGTINDLLFAPYEEEESDPHGLILRLASITDESDEPNDGDGRWSVRSPDGTGAVGAGQWTFSGGKMITQEFRLLDDAESDGYYPPGTYRFETKFRLRSVETQDVVATFVWGLSVILSREKQD
jgi:hypothetical protein